MIIDEIRAGETKNTEFKISLPEKAEKYIKSIVAYANTSGGKLIVGVEDKTREIVGVKSEDIPEIIDKITNTIDDMITPQIIPSITSAEIDGKSIIIVEIFPGPSRPYYIKSQGEVEGTYVKINATTRHADDIMLKELQLQGRKQSYDELILPNKAIDEASVNTLCMTMEKHREEIAEARGEVITHKDITPENLENWNIVKREGGVLSATVAYDLLTENTQRFARIQCGLFKGTDKVIFIDKREFAGPVYEQIEEAYQFVLKHINLGAEIEGIYRREFYELPPEAIREAIANAVTHRNYMDNACIQVCVYDNRVEIRSPGMLYGGLTIDMMKRGYTRIRNSALAEAFSRMYVIEGWGTGVKRMIDQCHKYGVVEPVFTETGVDFIVEFFRKNVLNGQDVPINVPINVPIKHIIEKYSDRYPELRIIADNAEVTTAELALTLGCDRRTVTRHIKKLREIGILRRSGSNRDGFWEIIATE